MYLVMSYYIVWKYVFVKGHYDTVSGFTSCQFNVCPWSFTARCGSHSEESGQDCALAIILIIIRWPITSQQNAHSVFIQTYLWHVILPQDFRVRLIPLAAWKHHPGTSCCGRSYNTASCSQWFMFIRRQSLMWRWNSPLKLTVILL